MQKRMNFKSAEAILLLLSLLVATVASVPNSVLAQKYEMISNSKLNGNTNSYNNNNDHFANFKVKRSSDNLKESAAAAAAAALNKKSNPEVVPDSYNSRSHASSSAATSSSSTALPSREFNADDGSGLSFSSNGNVFNSAVAAGLTSAAIKAAAAANQRQDEQQRQLQYATDDYDDNNGDEAPPLLRKRGISPQQYLYEANRASYGNPDYYINPSGVGGGVPLMRDIGDNVWSDDVDGPYVDVPEYNNYSPKASYRNKGYDNLQNILNSESYSEPVALPVQYPSSRYYDVDAKKRKRSNLNKLNQISDLRYFPQNFYEIGKIEVCTWLNKYNCRLFNIVRGSLILIDAMYDATGKSLPMEPKLKLKEDDIKRNFDEIDKTPASFNTFYRLV